jgi:hypothetical protein
LETVSIAESLIDARKAFYMETALATSREARKEALDKYRECTKSPEGLKFLSENPNYFFEFDKGYVKVLHYFFYSNFQERRRLWGRRRIFCDVPVPVFTG